MKQAGLIVLLMCAVAGNHVKTSQAAGDESEQACFATGSQMDITACEERRPRKMESTLKISYRQLFDVLDDEHRDLLKSAQSAWVYFREGNCQLEASQTLHGSMHEMSLDSCRAAMTETCTEEILEVKECLVDFLR